MLTKLIPSHSKTILGTQKILQRSVRKLYFLTSGRNAWHSTWIKQYRAGCMYIDPGLAGRHAEKMRKNGSVFYIEEIPALILQGESVDLVITQINCETVLADYSPNGLPPYRRAGEPSRNFLLPGSLMLSAVNSLDRDSRYWKLRPPKNNSVLIFTSSASLNEFEKYTESSVVKYRSESHGTENALYWRESARTGQSKALRNILKMRNRGLSPEKFSISRSK